MLGVLGVIVVFGIILFIRDKKENSRLDAYSKTAKEMNELLCAIKIDADIVSKFNDILLTNKNECVSSFFENKNINNGYNYKYHAIYNMIKISRKYAFHSDIENTDKDIYKKIIFILYSIIYKHLPNNFNKDIFDIKCNRFECSDEERIYCKDIERQYMNEVIKNDNYIKNPNNDFSISVKNIERNLGILSVIDECLCQILDKHTDSIIIKDIIRNRIFEDKPLNMLCYDIEKRIEPAFKLTLQAVSVAIAVEVQNLKKNNSDNESLQYIEKLSQMEKVIFGELYLYELRMKRHGKYDITKEEYDTMLVYDGYNIIETMIINKIDVILEVFFEKYKIQKDACDIIIKYINYEKKKIIDGIKIDKSGINLNDFVYDKIEAISYSMVEILNERSVGERDRRSKNEFIRIQKILLEKKTNDFTKEIFNG